MISFLEFLKEQTRYYHGSSDAILDPNGYRLLPPNVTGKIQEKGRKKNLDKIFYTTDENSARIYAGRATRRFGGNPVVVRAIPMGEVNAVNTKAGTSVYSSPWGFYEQLPTKK
jgi:hypothetical protein